MNAVHLAHQNDIAIIDLNNGPTNPVSPSLVDSLNTALDQVERQSRGLVLCGGEKFFCIGLDLPSLIKLSRKDMEQFWYAFNQMILKLYTLPMPTACAVQGHSPGAGAIIALSCDFRYGADEKALIGFNEIQLNIPVPYLANLMLRSALNESDADELLFGGQLISPQKAKLMGLLKETFPKKEVKAQAIKAIEPIASFSADAFIAMKSIKTTQIKDLCEQHFKAQHNIFLNAWFSDKGQIALNKALKNF